VEPIQVRTYAGTAGPVVVLHGGPGAPGSLAGLAADLAPDFEVWEPLQRPSGEVPLTVDRHVADLHDIAPNPATIVGHSWGAMLGLSYAARYPAAVRALALVGCGTYDTASRAEYKRRIKVNLGIERNRQKQELRAAIERSHDSAERDRLLGLIGALNTEAQSFDVLPDDHVVTVDAVGHEQTWRDVLRRQATGLEPQSFHAIGSLVLMLHGDDDPHPGTMIRDTLLPHIPQLEYVGIPRCGHEPWRERHGREPFLTALQGWLRER
jgi:pimeloyl-ACP methyl ester carboxylesterase